MLKYKVGELVETKYFYSGSHSSSEIKRCAIEEIDESHYHIIFDDGQMKRIGIKTFERLSKKFDPGSGMSRKFKFLS